MGLNSLLNPLIKKNNTPHKTISPPIIHKRARRELRIFSNIQIIVDLRQNAVYRYPPLLWDRKKFHQCMHGTMTVLRMAEQVKAVLFEAYEHTYPPKTSDWFLILGILTLSIAIASILLGNALFGVLIFIAGLVMALLAMKEPKIVSYAVTQRGIRIDDKLFPYTTLHAYYIDEDAVDGPELLIKSEKMFMPLLVLPLPEDTLDTIEDIIAERLPETHIEKPFGYKVLEFFNL
jgi:hypothetical protein